GPGDGRALLHRDDEQRFRDHLRPDSRRPDELDAGPLHAGIQAWTGDGRSGERGRHLALPLPDPRAGHVFPGAPHARDLAVVRSPARRAVVAYLTSAPFVLFALFPFAWMLITSIDR